MIEQIGPYKVLNELGQGGMAKVYRAHQPSVNRIIALKVLPANLESDNNAVNRFRQEAETAANLNHENIVKVWEASVHQSPFYIAMEYLDGGTLADLLVKRLLSINEAIAILNKLSSALDYAHHLPSGGVIHRDIKPANIMFDGNGRPVLMDFGIARMANQTRLTADGTKFGTPDYMSPEQAKGITVDYRSDIYSLAVVFYEMVTNRPPFLNENSMVTMRQIIDEPLPPPSQWNPEINAAMEFVLIKVLAKRPEDRYQSCAEFAQTLSIAFNHPESIHIPNKVDANLPMIADRYQVSPAEIYLHKDNVSRNPLLLGALIAVILLTIGMIGTAAMNNKRQTGRIPPKASATTTSTPNSATPSATIPNPSNSTVIYPVPPIVGNTAVREQPPAVYNQPPVANNQPPVLYNQPPVVPKQPPVIAEQPPVAPRQPPVVYKQPNVVTTPSQTWPCPKCGASFGSEKDLDRHRVDVHGI